MNDRPTLLLEHHLKELRLPSFLREYGKMAAQCVAEGVDHPTYLLRLAELELIDRHQRMAQRRIRAARLPSVKSLDTFDFTAIPSVNKPLVLSHAWNRRFIRRSSEWPGKTVVPAKAGTQPRQPVTQIRGSGGAPPAAGGRPSLLFNSHCNCD